MAEQIQELINRIKNEGIQTAEEKATQIEQDANAKATQIIADAEKQAADLKAHAQEEIKRTQESTQKALEQSGRDMLLSLRQRIEQSLNKILSQEVSGALSSDQLGKILTDVIKSTASDQGQTVVELSANDLNALKSTVVGKLQDSVKGGVSFNSSDDIQGGFTISYDAGKSSYDFTDESLANYLGTFVNDQVATILKDAA